MTTTQRLLALLSLLVSRTDWTAADLAAEHEVDLDTLAVGIDGLRDLGYAIITTDEPEWGYRFDRRAQFPIPVAARHGVDEGAAAVAAAGQPGDVTSEADTRAILALGAAIQMARIVRFAYGAASGSDGPTRPREVEPHYVVTWHGRWYLVAYDVDRGAWSAFRVDRLALQGPSGPEFTPRELPGNVDVTTFMLARFRGDENDVEWPCRGEVVVGLPTDQVRPYVGDGVAEAVDQGRTRVVLGSWSWAGLAASLLRFDAELEVVGPPELAEAFRELGVHDVRLASEPS